MFLFQFFRRFSGCNICNISDVFDSIFKKFSSFPNRQFLTLRSVFFFSLNAVLTFEDYRLIKKGLNRTSIQLAFLSMI